MVTIMLTFFLFVVGFALLIKGADLLVAGSSSVAKKFGISSLVIGLTIVAFGTSAPELVVNLLASINGNTDIAIGNILGSNIVNILLILGIAGVIYPLAVGRGTIYKEIPFALLAVIVLGFMANDIFFDGAVASVLGRIDGLILISFFAIFLYYIFSIAKDGNNESEDEIKMYSTGKSSLMIFAGLVGLVVGGKWIVDGAIVFASNMGVSEALIGLTIVAVGTSLPELATSAVAAYRKNADIAIGNVVGSNIFNVFWILGISAVIRPLPFSPALAFDMGVTIFVTILLFIAVLVGQKYKFERWQGIVFILLYVAYVVYLVIRG